MIGIACVDNNWGIAKDGKLLFHNKEDMKFFKQQTETNAVIYGNNTLKSFPGMKPLKNRLNVVYTRDFDNIPKEAIEAADLVYRINSVNHLMPGLIPDVDWTLIKGEYLYELYKDTYMMTDCLTHITLELRDIALNDNLTILVITTNLRDAVLIPRVFGYSLDDTYSLSGEGKGSTFVIGGEYIYDKLIPYCNKCYITKMNENKNADQFFPNLDTKEWNIKASYRNAVGATKVSFKYESDVEDKDIKIAIYTRNIKYSNLLSDNLQWI